jgi:rhamnose transport system permease protein
MIRRRYGRELSTAIALASLLVAVGVIAPQFYSARNLLQILINNTSVLIVAIGMTMVILVGQIDISVGSQFAIASVVTGLAAQAGAPIFIAGMAGMLAGTVMGLLNAALVAGAGIPSIVVTLATMVAFRDALRWTTEGRWVQNLPPPFQWAGFGQAGGEVLNLLITAVLFVAAAWGLGNLPAGRALYATGSDTEAARLAGIRPAQVVFSVFVLMGLLTGLAAALNAIRFSEIQSNVGVGVELKTIAAVVVGGASITGGRATLLGTLLGVLLLGIIGPALTFAGINAFWEKAIQGLIILAAVVADARGKARARVVQNR